MNKSSSEILREYATIIAEAQEEEQELFDEPNGDPEFDPQRDEMPQEDNGIDLPDESMQEPESGDPVQELANFLSYKDAAHIDYEQAINEFLKKNNLEITPVGGLSNKQGNV